MFQTQIRYFLFYIIGGILLFSSCRYKEGPVISLRSKCERITGIYEVEHLFIDGADSTTEVTGQSYYGKVSFLYDCDNTDISSLSGAGIHGSWKLTDDKDKLGISLFPSNFIPVGPYGFHAYIEWEILRLTNKEMWLKVFYSNKMYELHFKKTDDIKCHWCI